VALNRRVADTVPTQLLVDAGVRNAFEAGFGHDFSSVRVRSDPQAARAVNARAFTRGEEIVLGERPSVGLLAHELAHVVQQRLGGGPPGPAHDAEADAAARVFEGGGRAEVALGSAPGAVQLASPVAGPTSPSWLNGLNTRHVSGNIWEVEFKTGGWHMVGPYRELDNYRRRIGLAGDSHHIVGGEHLLDLNSTFTYENAPAVVLEEGLHERVVTPRIGFEQAVEGGRRGGRPVITQADVKRMYRAAYIEQAPFNELSRIANNIVDQSTSAPPAAATKAVTSAVQATEEVNLAGKATVTAKKQFVAGEKSAIGAIKSQALAAEEKALAKGTQIELGVAEKPALKGMGLSGGPSPVKLAVAGMGIQIAGGLLQAWMYKSIRDSVMNLPKPSITAARVWRDEATRAKYVPVELLAANLPHIQEDLELSLGRNTIQLIAFWSDLDMAPPEQRLELLDSLEDSVFRSQADVLKAQGNVGRMLELEPQILESVAAARDVQAIVSNPAVMGFGASFVGFDLGDLMKISDNLAWFQASFTRGVLVPLHGIANALARAEASNEAVLAQVKRLRTRIKPRVMRPR
jgi:hypothetical protein